VHLEHEDALLLEPPLDRALDARLGLGHSGQLPSTCAVAWLGQLRQFPYMSLASKPGSSAGLACDGGSL
jgi:hypothetical protein